MRIFTVEHRVLEPAPQTAFRIIGGVVALIEGFVLWTNVGVEEAVVIALFGFGRCAPAQIGSPGDMTFIKDVGDVDVVGELIFLQIAASIGAERHALDTLEFRTVDIPGNASRGAPLFAQPDQKMTILDLVVAIEPGEIVPPHLAEFRWLNGKFEEVSIKALSELVNSLGNC